MEQELKNAQSMNDVLRIVNKYYNLDAPLGIASKIVVINGLKTVLKMIKAQPK
jgi:hypothetical protein